MLKRIEIKNFESHKHTVISDLSDGVNLFRGESNAGKTSIVRALKLAAYNQFDPKSLRTGETKCEVTVETDKGIVKVVRGPKINFWEVTPKGKTPLTFDKVGRNIIPEAARVIGLNIVKLGDADIPVNIMDQLESHFMLASLAGQDATGSLRAQVIDEISGLSGIEGVIKAVSLDNHRFSKEIKETEDKMQEAQVQMHNEQALVQEQSILDSAEQDITQSDQCLKAVIDAQLLLDEYNKVANNIQTSEEALDRIPDVTMAGQQLDISTEWMRKTEKAEEIHTTIVNTQQEITRTEDKLTGIPDVDEVLKLIDDSEQSLEVAERMERLLSEYRKITERTAELNANFEVLEQMGDPLTNLVTVQNALEVIERAKSMLESISTIQGQINASEGRLRANEVALKKAEADRDAILATIKVCPVNLKPILPQCLKG